MNAINLAEKLSGFAEHWQPRVVGIRIRTANTGDAATAAPRRII